MAELQLGLTLKPEDQANIVAFLKPRTCKQPDFKVPMLPLFLSSPTPR